MAHFEQIVFCTKIKNRFPDYFKNKRVLDVGSLDINGSNHYLLENCSYLGVDVGAGPNVDVVCIAHEFNEPDESYDLILSTECFEHDRFYDKTINNIIRLLKSGGMFLFTCATTGRPEHGTVNSRPEDAPLIQNYDEWQMYYKNLTEEDIRNIVDIDAIFSDYEFEVNEESKDLYFYGIKK